MTIPENAIIARRPFFNSLTASFLAASGDLLNTRGSKPKSPGLRSPFLRAATAGQEMISRREVL